MAVQLSQTRAFVQVRPLSPLLGATIARVIAISTDDALSSCLIAGSGPGAASSAAPRPEPRGVRGAER